MMDIADLAQEQELPHLEAAIANARVNDTPKLKHTGECHQCGEQIESPKLFCDGICAKKHGRVK